MFVTYEMHKVHTDELQALQLPVLALSLALCGTRFSAVLPGCVIWHGMLCNTLTPCVCVQSCTRAAHKEDLSRSLSLSLCICHFLFASEHAHVAYIIPFYTSFIQLFEHGKLCIFSGCYSHKKYGESGE